MLGGCSGQSSPSRLNALNASMWHELHGNNVSSSDMSESAKCVTEDCLPYSFTTVLRVFGIVSCFFARQTGLHFACPHSPWGLFTLNALSSGDHQPLEREKGNTTLKLQASGSLMKSIKSS
ncbi:Uncharacterized protein HZ326_4545 [Fusarium oxysporum f. sp. albedinis]|nr:Uncharacterized protein HZ326_4545 [Fusarium oxysporum f. sp. albedinis]